MLRLGLLAVGGMALLAASPALSASEEEVRQQIEQVLGDAAGFESAAYDISEAIATDDPDALSALTEFPLGTSGEDVADSEGLAERWDEIFNEKVKTAVDQVRYDQLIVTDQGVGVGNGEIWINHICDDDSCTKAHWALSRVNY